MAKSLNRSLTDVSLNDSNNNHLEPCLEQNSSEPQHDFSETSVQQQSLEDYLASENFKTSAESETSIEVKQPEANQLTHQPAAVGAIAEYASYESGEYESSDDSDDSLEQFQLDATELEPEDIKRFDFNESDSETHSDDDLISDTLDSSTEIDDEQSFDPADLEGFELEAADLEAFALDDISDDQTDTNEVNATDDLTEPSIDLSEAEEESAESLSHDADNADTDSYIDSQYVDSQINAEVDANSGVDTNSEVQVNADVSSEILGSQQTNRFLEDELDEFADFLEEELNHEGELKNDEQNGSHDKDNRENISELETDTIESEELKTEELKTEEFETENRNTKDSSNIESEVSKQSLSDEMLEHEPEVLAESLTSQIEETDVEPDPLDEFEGRVEKKPVGFRNSMIAAAAMVLAALGSYQFWDNRQTLAWDETWGGLTHSVCGVLPCDIQPRRDLSKIRLKQRQVMAAESDQEKLDIKLSLVNIADFDQPYPQINIKFSNSVGQFISQAKVSAADYFPEKSKLLMSSQTEAHISFQVDMPHSDAVGFEFSFE